MDYKKFLEWYVKNRWIIWSIVGGYLLLRIIAAL